MRLDLDLVIADLGLLPLFLRVTRPWLYRGGSEGGREVSRTGRFSRSLRPGNTRHQTAEAAICWPEHSTLNY